MERRRLKGAPTQENPAAAGTMTMWGSHPMASGSGKPRRSRRSLASKGHLVSAQPAAAAHNTNGNEPGRCLCSGPKLAQVLSLGHPTFPSSYMLALASSVFLVPYALLGLVPVFISTISPFASTHILVRPNPLHFVQHHLLLVVPVTC